MSEYDRKIDGGHEWGILARRSARSWAPGTWGVAEKLWLAFGLLVLVLGVSGLVSYRSIQRIDRDLLRVVAVEEPLERAVLEMEINAGEGARAVFGYVRDLAPEHIEKLRDSKVDFERFAADFERLAETDEARRLGQEVAGLYGELKVLGDEIVALADRRRGALRKFRQSVEQIDEILDERLKPSAKGNTPDAKKKRGPVVALDELLGETFPAIEAYLVQRDPALRKGFLHTATNFERLLALYRKTGLSAEETGWLDRIDQIFAAAVSIGNRIMTVTDELNTRLDEFEEHLKTIDAILDDEIQPLIHAEAIEAADDAKAATDRAALYLIFLGLVGLCIASVAAWAISRTILGPIRALVRGAEIVGGGDLAHRIGTGSGDEFGHLATAFNRMVENLQRSGEALRDSKVTLQTRVADLEEAQRKLERQGESLVRLADDLRIARDATRGADRAKSEFLANMSHELRTPLNAIIGFSEIIKGEIFGSAGNPKYREYANNIHESGQHLLAIISDILDLSQIDTGKPDLRDEHFDLAEVVAPRLNLITERAKTAGVTLTTNIDK